MYLVPVTIVDYKKQGAPGEALEVDRLSSREVEMLRHVLLGEFIRSSKNIFTSLRDAEIICTTREDFETKQPPSVKHESQYREELFELLNILDINPIIDLGNSALLVGFEQIRHPVLFTVKRALERVLDDQTIISNIGLPSAPPQYRMMILKRLQEFINKAIELSGPT
jgi:hypothetical protein